MHRPIFALLALVLVAGCTASNTDSPSATASVPSSDPFAGSTPAATPGSTVVKPTTLPPPSEPAPRSGFVLHVGSASDGSLVWLDANNSANPTLLVPPSTQITIEVLRDGATHGLDVDGKVLLGAGTTDERVTFETPTSGAIEYGCPVHPHTMRGTLRVA